MPLCLSVGAVAITLFAEGFTLAWTHSVEKIRWEEDWRIEGERFVISEARIRGTGAGMEPPDGARFDRGSWHYRPWLPPQPELQLALSGLGDYELCVGAACKPLLAFLAREIPLPAVARLWPCRHSSF